MREIIPAAPKLFVFVTLMSISRFPFVIEGDAVGYVHKLNAIDELIPAVRAVVLGGSYVSRSFRQDA